jgi:hypothetical protein
MKPVAPVTKYRMSLPSDAATAGEKHISATLALTNPPSPKRLYWPRLGRRASEPEGSHGGHDTPG